MAMWHQYAGQSDGVTIKTTFRRLCDSFAPASESVYVGLVRYLDYESDAVSVHTIFAPFMHKRSSFEHEREIRAVVWKPATNADGTLGLGPTSMGDGASVPVDLSTLIAAIHVPPRSKYWYLNAVEAAVRGLGCTVPVVRSSMDSPAIF
jgi:hypothetical protein